MSANVAESIARYIDSRGLAAYKPDQAGGEVYLHSLPPVDGFAVAVRLMALDRSAPAGYALARVQVYYRYRGDVSGMQAAYDRVLAIHETIRSITSETLTDDGMWVVTADSVSGPVLVDTGADGEWLWSAAYELDIQIGEV